MSDNDTNDLIVFNTSNGSTVQQKEIPLFVLVPESSPCLTQVMPPFDFDNPIMDPEALASSLVETCKQLNGFGLSANQVGVDARVFVMGQGDQYIACFNPELIAVSKETVHMVEGCLSYPMLSLMITRPTGVVVEYQDFEGKKHKANFVGISARCFLHELDHMNGIVYTSRAKPVALQQGLKKRNKINNLMKKAQKKLEKIPYVNTK